FQDASSRRIPFQKKIGVGLDDAEFQAQVAAGTLRHVGLGESLHFIAKNLGLHIDRWEESLQPVHADKNVSSELGAVKKGAISGVMQEARGFDGDRGVVKLLFQAAAGIEAPHYRSISEGAPPRDRVWRRCAQAD